MIIKILIPVFNDWQSVTKLVSEINKLSIDSKFAISIVIINDASSHDRHDKDQNLDNIHSIKILNMKINQGHARCIATGLKYIYEEENFDYIIPMDGDGEDRPEEIKEFLNQIEKSNNKPLIGERIKRSEGLLFKIFYQLHKLITLTFTGKSIKFGNYTCLPRSIVEKMINEKATWSSFSGSLAKVAHDRATIPSERGIRYSGPSKMSFKNLTIHSLAIISVFKFNVLARSISFLLVYMFLIHQKISIIMLIPLPLIILLVVLVFLTSKRESLEEMKDSFSNILNIENIK